MKLLLLSLAALVFSLPALAQKTILIGKIKDEQNQAIPFSTLSIPALKKGVTSDQTGTYSIVLPSGTYQIKASAVGYKSKLQSVTLSATDTLYLDFN